MGITVLANFDCTTLVVVIKKLQPLLNSFILEMNTWEETAAYHSKKGHGIFNISPKPRSLDFAVSFNVGGIEIQGKLMQKF